MRKSIGIAILMALTVSTILLATACVRNEGPDASAAPSAMSGERFFFAAVCKEDTPEEVQSAMRSARSERTHAYEEVCVNTRSTSELNPDVFRIYLHSENLIAINLQCRDDGTHAALVNSLDDQGELALVANDVVLGVFRYFDKGDLNAKCGVIPQFDLHEALDLCEDARMALNADVEHCSSVCNAKLDSEVRPVCVVVNASP